jgi:parvulin-like peptidyl-prolyl isomerase
MARIIEVGAPRGKRARCVRRARCTIIRRQPMTADVSPPSPPGRPSRLRLAAGVLAAGLAASALAGEPPAAPAAPAPQAPDRAADGTRLAARINGEEIKFSEFARSVNQYVVANHLGPDSGLTIPEIQRAVMDRVIATSLVDQRARELGFTATPEEVDARVNSVKSQVGDPAEFRLMLAVQSLTEDRLRDQLARQIAAEKLMDAEVFAKIEVPAADVKAYYESHKDELKQPERAKLHQIFVALRRDMTDAERLAARAKIDGIKGRLDKGEDFSKVAVELSEDGSAASGGDLGWVSKDEVSGPFQLVAFTTPVGKVSDVVATDYGYVIVRVDDRQDARPMTLDEARPTIEEALKDERVPHAVQDYIAALRAKAQIETFLPKP